jgi:hypothetical protein
MALRVSRLVAIAAVPAAAAVFVLATLPPSPRRVNGADAALADRTIPGAFHVHTTRSDGLGDRTAVARAAREAGLRFVVLTDHGDGTRPADPAEYVEDVLLLDGVEISADGGHYIAIGAAPSPYPLGGESADVAEDVARLGGFGVAAHPMSPRPELAWSNWSAQIDGLEWLSADSEWRDESRWQLSRALSSYLFRPGGALGALLDRPSTALARWDALSRDRRVVGIAGHDAHGGIGRRLEDRSQRRSVPVPSYEASFRTFSTRVILSRSLTSDARADGEALLAALRAGKFYTSIDSVAPGETLDFTARVGGEVVEQGGRLETHGPASFAARAAVPEGATIVGFRNGVEIARNRGGTLTFESAEPGSHRVEVHVDGAPGEPPVPWLVSNPIFRWSAAPRPPDVVPSTRTPLREARWRIEKDEGSAGTFRVDDRSGEVTFEYRLREGPRVSQFAALVTDLPADLPVFDAVSFAARSATPRRVSVQLRFGPDGQARWARSVYVDANSRSLSAAIRDFRRADGPPDLPDPRRATSLLFVVDLTNANPGDRGEITLRDVGFSR